MATVQPKCRLEQLSDELRNYIGDNFEKKNYTGHISKIVEAFLEINSAEAESLSTIRNNVIYQVHTLVSKAFKEDTIKNLIGLVRTSSTPLSNDVNEFASTYFTFCHSIPEEKDVNNKLNIFRNRIDIAYLIKNNSEKAAFACDLLKLKNTLLKKYANTPLEEHVISVCSILEEYANTVARGNRIPHGLLLNLLASFRPCISPMSAFDSVCQAASPLLGRMLKFVDFPEKIETLRLQNFGLKEVPEELREFKNLKSLFLDNNHIVSLPNWMKELKNLNILSLECNRLTRFIMEFPQLTELYLNSNKLFDSLTIELSIQSYALQTLEMRGNGMSTIPSDLQSLKSLQNVDFSFNEIFTLDPLIDCKELIHLNISVNKALKDLSPILKLSKLKKLICSHTCVEQLPDLNGLGLYTLNCNFCQLKSLFDIKPESALAKSLSDFEARHNELKEIPQSWQHLERIERIIAPENSITKIPDRFKSTRLITLNLYRNKLKSIGTCLYFFQNAWLGRNNLRELPNIKYNPEIELSLSILNLCGNQIQIVENYILKMLYLRQLTLSFNHLNELFELSAIGPLSHIDISHNSLKEESLQKFLQVLRNIQRSSFGYPCQAESVTEKKVEIQKSMVSRAQSHLLKFDIKENFGAWRNFASNHPDREIIQNNCKIMLGPTVVADQKTAGDQPLVWEDRTLTSGNNSTIFLTQTNGEQIYQQDVAVSAVKPISGPLDSFLARAMAGKILLTLDARLKDPHLKEGDELLIGSGAMAACLLSDGKHIYLCNVGDCAVLSITRKCIERAIIAYKQHRSDFTVTAPQIWGSNFQKLREMHKLGASLTLEEDWEIRAGGLPTYSVIGDAYHPEIPCEVSDVIKLDRMENPLVILATDGLWDVYSPEDVVEEICEAILVSGDTEEKRRGLLETTIQRTIQTMRDRAFGDSYTIDGKCDNITIVSYWAKEEAVKDECEMVMVFDGHDKRKSEGFVRYIEREAVKLFLG